MLDSNPSLERVCLEVKPEKSSGFQMPNVVTKQTSRAFKTVFVQIYQASDQNGSFELNACEIASATGVSRRRVYDAISFLQRVNLLKKIESRTGRGKHSTFKLNWRKPTPPKARKCATRIPYTSELKNIHPTGDSHDQNILQPKNQKLWSKCMIAFRTTLEVSSLAPGQRRLCMGVLGRFLKNKSRETGLKLYERLNQVVRELRAPQWARTAQELCRWFWGLIKSLFKPVQQRGRKFDFNEYQWELMAREKDRVRKRRGDGGLSAEESWGRWIAEQDSNQVWVKNRADLARQKLREVHRNGGGSAGCI